MLLTLPADLALDRENIEFDDRANRMLASLIQDPFLHGRFLNLLSYLEYTGLRKIALSQHSRSVKHEVLRHLAEESRHAAFFKREADRLIGYLGEGFNETNTLALTHGKAYFNGLETFVHRSFRNDVVGSLTYLSLSFIIERRACWFYRIYESSLDEGSMKRSLRRVLAEEHMHIAGMFHLLEKLCDRSSLIEFASRERSFFTALLGAIERAIICDKAIPAVAVDYPVV